MVVGRTILPSELAKALCELLESDDPEAIIQLASDGERLLIDGHFDLESIACALLVRIEETRIRAIASEQSPSE